MTYEELAEIVSDKDDVSWLQFLSSRYAKPILLAVLIAFFNQVSGINAIIYYAPSIFEMTGAETSAALLATIGIGVVNVVFTLIGFTLIGIALIDRLGRKTLMFIGSIGYIVSLGMVARGFFFDTHTLTPFFIFAFIAGMMVVQLIYVLTFMVESKSKSLEALSTELLKP